MRVVLRICICIFPESEVRTHLAGLVVFKAARSVRPCFQCSPYKYMYDETLVSSSSPIVFLSRLALSIDEGLWKTACLLRTSRLSVNGRTPAKARGRAGLHHSSL